MKGGTNCLSTPPPQTPSAETPFSALQVELAGSLPVPFPCSSLGIVQQKSPAVPQGAGEGQGGGQSGKRPAVSFAGISQTPVSDSKEAAAATTTSRHSVCTPAWEKSRPSQVTGVHPGSSLPSAEAAPALSLR